MTEDEQQKIEFGKRLRELRKRRGLSAEQLGDKLGVARTTVFGYEQGQRIPDMITIKKIAELFNVTVDYLLGVQLKPPSHNVREVLSRSDLTWDGIPLTEEELKQTRDFLSFVCNFVCKPSINGYSALVLWVLFLYTISE